MAKKQKHHTELKSRILSIGIAVLFVMFIAYGINTFYEEPRWDNYCSKISTLKIVETASECEAMGGNWTDYQVYGKPKIVEESNGYCDLYYQCGADYKDSRETYNRNIFFASLIVGILTFVVAIFLMVESVSAGFMGGGILLILYGTLRYWGSLSDIWRTLMLGFALAVLVWVGYKKLK